MDSSQSDSKDILSTTGKAFSHSHDFLSTPIRHFNNYRGFNKQIIKSVKFKPSLKRYLSLPKKPSIATLGSGLSISTSDFLLDSMYGFLDYGDTRLCNFVGASSKV